MTALLSKYFTEYEIDRVVSFLGTISNSKFDINHTIGDAESQLRLIIGTERYHEIKVQWAIDNQALLKAQGQPQRYVRLSDGKIFDGLDAEDNPLDFRKVYV